VFAYVCVVGQVMEGIGLLEKKSKNHICLKPFLANVTLGVPIAPSHEQSEQVQRIKVLIQEKIEKENKIIKKKRKEKM
jgi:hypothetical protein